ncbi:MAG: hypothetical protein IJM73_06955, partial [Spirochaetales bacterium]|nr:hypothetical protein [Spirochaetales bacterium]
YEVQKYLMKTQHMLACSSTIINSDLWESLSAEDQATALASIADGSHGAITVDELYEAYFNTGNERSIASEFAGPAAAAYYNIITEELRALHLGTTATAEEACAKIVSRANEAIANAQ